MKPTSLIPVLALLAPLAMAEAQRDPAAVSREWMDNCDRGDHRYERVCEVRPHTLQPMQRITVDGRQNGGIRVTGWDRNEIHVVARIQASGRTEQEARALASRVQVTVRDGRISADGPDPEWSGSWWSASFDVYVPRRTDLDLVAHNGGITVTDVSGRLEMQTTNGGVRLANVSGDVRGRTTNGGVSVTLTGSRWQGAGLDVRTTNGGVSLTIPDGYSARLETGTVNGSMRINFPITVQGRIGRELSTDIGSGGPPVRVSTTNGGVTIRRS